MSMTSAITHTPTRACLAGEDLDWLGHRSVCVAADLPTRIQVAASGAQDPHPEVEATATAVWNHMRRSLPGPTVTRRPAVSVDASAPLASGLSSSSSLVIGLLRAFARYLGVEVDGAALLEWSYTYEYEIYHGGGMDQTSIIAGGAVRTEGRDGSVPVLTGCVPFPEEWRIVVVDSATPKSTVRHLADVRRQSQEGDRRLDDYITAADRCAAQVWSAIADSDLTLLGSAMEQAHTAMRDIQHMSSSVLEDIRQITRRTVGLPLKVTGAGGGGSMIGVCPRGDAGEIQRSLSRSLKEAYPRAQVLIADAVPVTGELEVARPHTRSGATGLILK
ncbi:hypothetical protein I3J09_30655 (plasmid) [Streptomyces clavuligerus]|uniref:Mevalonate kinase n=2 Tax=Streptomyces clavuligerus TaxID=1901 RepID=B5GMF9_STRCL|nr:hypothetical protein [Streptomyces clavuligerus]ANW22374.1 hypothetical protein BB341_29035 [Streptomyces clavuligerus]AXU17278.1 hypothetical protein D1794_32150 [Streptomyces clavuligerus]EDY47505.1 hypothetical protein SSCG_00533 [Streptomyces clavuligerus]EFG04465.1 mevalonate kinase [Streptomyces clavuligerus]MBY6307077.1 hypothetical protein [Streptomyces clavuligerus]